MSMSFLLGVPGMLQKMLNRLTPARANNLDKINRNVSDIAPASTALSNSVWSDQVAANISLILSPTWTAEHVMITDDFREVSGNPIDLTGPGIVLAAYQGYIGATHTATIVVDGQTLGTVTSHENAGSGMFFINTGGVIDPNNSVPIPYVVFDENFQITSSQSGDIIVQWFKL